MLKTKSTPSTLAVDIWDLMLLGCMFWNSPPQQFYRIPKMHEAMKQLPWSFWSDRLRSNLQKEKQNPKIGLGRLRLNHPRNLNLIISKALETWAFHVSGLCLTWLGITPSRYHPGIFLKFGQKKISKSIWWSIMGSWVFDGFATHLHENWSQSKVTGREKIPPRKRVGHDAEVPCGCQDCGRAPEEFRWCFFCGWNHKTKLIAIQNCSIKFLFTRTVSSEFRMMPTSWNIHGVFQLKCSRLCPNCKHSHFSGIA